MFASGSGIDQPAIKERRAASCCYPVAIHQFYRYGPADHVRL
jgi:hypothetical protein